MTRIASTPSPAAQRICVRSNSAARARVDSSALAIGPGLGRSDEARALVRTLLGTSSLPVVVDADGLFGLEPAPRDAPTILTPHAGELARLLEVESAWVAAHRLEAAARAAERFGAVVLLKGADTIVQLEWTDGGIETVRINQAPRRGLHIRRAGEDIAPGNLVLAAGTVLGAAQIGLLAAVNVARPAVHPRPRVAVLSTGSELVEVGTPLGPGQIVDSNSHAIAAAAHEAGALVRRVDGVSDDPDEFGATFDELLRSTDVVITTGGISVGARDVVKQVLSKSDEIRFERIAMQPGKPQGFGVVGGVPVFTLPGNPVSALVSFELFVRPALRRMRGLPASPEGASWQRPATGTVTVRVSETMQSAAGRRTFPRVRLERDDTGELVATSAGGQGAHQMSGLASAHALLVVPEEVTEVPAGTKLPAVLLPEPEWAGPFGEARG